MGLLEIEVDFAALDFFTSVNFGGLEGKTALPFLRESIAVVVVEIDREEGAREEKVELAGLEEVDREGALAFKGFGFAGLVEEGPKFCDTILLVAVEDVLPSPLVVDRSTFVRRDSKYLRRTVRNDATSAGDLLGYVGNIYLNY